MSEIYIIPDGSALRSWATNYAGALMLSSAFAEEVVEAFKNLHGESYIEPMINLAKHRFPSITKYVPVKYLKPQGG